MGLKLPGPWVDVEVHCHCPRQVINFFPWCQLSFPLYMMSAKQHTLFSHILLFHPPITPSPGVGGCTVKQAEPLISKSSKHDGYKSKLLSPTGKTSERNHLLLNRRNKQLFNSVHQEQTGIDHSIKITSPKNDKECLISGFKQAIRVVKSALKKRSYQILPATNC